MICPHCGLGIHDERQLTSITFQGRQLVDDSFGSWFARSQICSECKNAIIFIYSVKHSPNTPRGQITERLIYPKSHRRKPVAQEVPKPLAEYYSEASMVLPDSPKASAALSRRRLQNLLRDYVKIEPSDLSREIQQLLDLKTLPSYISEAIDSVRNVGNFAAHPIKSTSTGEIVEVESSEAEWLLDTLESLFDFYFVQPAKLSQKRAELNAKLRDANKPALK